MRAFNSVLTRAAVKRQFCPFTVGGEEPLRMEASAFPFSPAPLKEAFNSSLEQYHLLYKVYTTVINS